MLLRISRATCATVCFSCANRVSEFASISARSSAGIGAFEVAYDKRLTARSTCVRNDNGSAAMCSSAVSIRIRLVANSIERSSLTDLDSVTDVAALAMLRPKFEKSGMCRASHAEGKPATDSRRRANALLRPALRLDHASLHRVRIEPSASIAGCNATTSISRGIRFGTNTSSSYSAFTLSTSGCPVCARATW